MSEYPYHEVPEKVRPAPIVPWYGKTWEEIQRHHMGQLEQHLVELTALKGKERAAEYLRYLKEQA